MTTLSRSNLVSQFSGVSSPSEMGATGLIAWMLYGKESGKNRWERYQIVKRIIAKRHGKRSAQSISILCKAIVATAHLYQININRFVAAVRKDMEGK